MGKKRLSIKIFYSISLFSSLIFFNSFAMFSEKPLYQMDFPDYVYKSIMRYGYWANEIYLQNVVIRSVALFDGLSIKDITLDHLIAVNKILFPENCKQWRTKALSNFINDPTTYKEWIPSYVSEEECKWLIEKMDEVESRRRETNESRQLEYLIYLPSESDSESSVESRLEASPLTKLVKYYKKTDRSQEITESIIIKVRDFLSIAEIHNNDPLPIIFTCYLELLSEQPFKYFNNLTAYIFMNVLLMKVGHCALPYSLEDHYNQYYSVAVLDPIDNLRQRLCRKERVIQQQELKRQAVLLEHSQSLPYGKEKVMQQQELKEKALLLEHSQSLPSLSTSTEKAKSVGFPLSFRSLTHSGSFKRKSGTPREEKSFTSSPPQSDSPHGSPKMTRKEKLFTSSSPQSSRSHGSPKMVRKEKLFSSSSPQSGSSPGTYKRNSTSLREDKEESSSGQEIPPTENPTTTATTTDSSKKDKDKDKEGSKRKFSYSRK